MKIIAEGNDETIVRTSFLRETEKAILVTDVDENEVWLPLSQIEVLEVGQGQCEISVPNWLIEAKELL